MGAMQRRKGAAGENELKSLLSGQLGRVCKRNLGQERDGGDDITIPRLGGGEICIESKRRRAIATLRFMEEAEAASDARAKRSVHGGRNIPLLAMREDGRKQWYVVMRLEDACMLLREEIEPTVDPEKAAASEGTLKAMPL